MGYERGLDTSGILGRLQTGFAPRASQVSVVIAEYVSPVVENEHYELCRGLLLYASDLLRNFATVTLEFDGPATDPSSVATLRHYSIKYGTLTPFKIGSNTSFEATKEAVAAHANALLTEYGYA